MQIVLEIPEQYHHGATAAELAQRIRLYAAILMFHTQELSAGAAAEFAGVDRSTFAAECDRHGIPLVDYPAADLQAELDSLRGSERC
jgi:predicted HTH domain antitoxin